MEKIKLMQGDCLELMKGIADKSVDMVLGDLVKRSKRKEGEGIWTQIGF